MPHQCTNCGNTFPDGSKEMLSGCPECGGNKFKFEPSGRSDSTTESRSAESGTQSTDTNPGSSTNRGPTDTGHEPGRSATADSEEDDPLASRSWPGESTDDSQTVDNSRAADNSQTADSSAGIDATDNSQKADNSRTTDPPTGIDATDDDFVSSDPEPTTNRNTTRDRPGSRSGRDPHADVEMETDDEDTAQADARSEVVSGSELPDKTPEDRRETPPEEEQSAEGQPAEGQPAGGQPAEGQPAGGQPAEGQPVEEQPTGGQPVEEQPTDAPGEDESDFENLREELNDQFESIRIVRPGQYELNLMELYDREEYIISLREDGRYVIEMPEAWDDPDE